MAIVCRLPSVFPRNVRNAAAPLIRHTVWAAIFGILLSIPLWAQGWVEKRNQEVTASKKLGWVFEVPSDWVAPPGGPAPYPVSETYVSPDGKASVQVLALSDERLSNEQTALESRGYSSSNSRLGGREATVWTRAGEKIYYVSTPQGSCRVRLASPNPTDPKLSHTVESFRFLALAASDKTWNPSSFQLGSNAYVIDTPSSWKLEKSSWKDGTLKLKVEEVAAEGRSLRGTARNTQPKEGSGWKLVAFEPLESDAGTDGYLATWTGSLGTIELAYFKMGDQTLCFQLYKADRDAGLRAVRSLRKS